MDLDGVQLTGEGSGGLRWKRAADGRFNADGQVRLSDFQWSMRQQPPWHDSDVQIQLAASGQTDFGGGTRLDAASLGVKLGSDQLEVRLAEPVTEICRSGPWAFHARMQGLLQNWAVRLAAWLPGGNWRIGGTCVVDADATVSAGGRRRTATPAPSDAAWCFSIPSGRQFYEPIVRLAVGGEYDGKTGEVQLGKAATGLQRPGRRRGGGHASRSAAVDAGRATKAQLGGQVNYDLGRLSELLRPCLGDNVNACGPRLVDGLVSRAA